MIRKKVGNKQQTKEISFGTGSTINQVKERLFDIYEDRFNFQESLDNEELLTEIQHQLCLLYTSDAADE